MCKLWCFKDNIRGNQSYAKTAQDSKIPIADPGRKFKDVITRQRKTTKLRRFNESAILDWKVVTYVSWALLK